MNDQQEPEFPKATWGPGPWQDEPDRCEWRDRLPCLAVRNYKGAWCGYVGIPKGILSPPTDQLEVHGGITYGPATCNGAICHVAQPGEPEVHWIGFDCSHEAFDLCPGSRWRLDLLYKPFASLLLRGSVYRNLEYVKGECKRLIDQVLAAGALLT